MRAGVLKTAVRVACAGALVAVMSACTLLGPPPRQAVAEYSAGRAVVTIDDQPPITLGAGSSGPYLGVLWSRGGAYVNWRNPDGWTLTLYGLTDLDSGTLSDGAAASPLLASPRPDSHFLLVFDHVDPKGAETRSATGSESGTCVTRYETVSLTRIAGTVTCPAVRWGDGTGVHIPQRPGPPSRVQILFEATGDGTARSFGPTSSP